MMDSRSPSSMRVVHIKLMVGAVVGMESDAQQTLFLSVEVGYALDIQKISRLQDAVIRIRMVPRCSTMKKRLSPGGFPYPPDC